ALAFLRASISARSAARATSTACAPCALAAASLALYASRKPLMIGAVRNCASHCSMGFSLFRVVIPAPAYRRQAKGRHCRAQRVVKGVFARSQPAKTGVTALKAGYGRA